MKIDRQSKRRGRRAKRVDPQVIADALKDRRVWTVLGVVVVPEGGSSHFRTVERGGKIVDVLVEVETSPGLLDLTCRLSSLGAGAASGLWMVPAVGSEVLVAVPDGMIDFQPTIVGVLSSGEVPSRAATEGRMVLVASSEIEITAPVVKLGPTPESINAVQDTLVHGMGTDAFTGAQYYALGNTTSKVRSKK